MLEKELITKKFLNKIIKERIRSVWGLIIVLPAILLLAFTTAQMLVIFNARTAVIVSLVVYIIPFIMAVFIIRDAIVDTVKLYSGKFYVVEASLTSKSQKECYRPRRYEPDYYIEYSFYFEKYGTYKIRSYEQFYKKSKENKMEPRIADIITEPGDKFYLLVRGGKKKQLVEIFHEKLFELDKNNFSLLYGKYYI